MEFDSKCFWGGKLTKKCVVVELHKTQKLSSGFETKFKILAKFCKKTFFLCLSNLRKNIHKKVVLIGSSMEILHIL